jgi:hypothetical protein
VDSVSFNELEFPETVYKYRNFENPLHLEIINNRQVYMTPPEDFDDPFDCKNFVCYDKLSNVQLLQWYFHHTALKIPYLKIVARTAKASEMYRNSMLKNPLYIKKLHDDEWKKFNDRFGILSLTADQKNGKMWKLYSNGHTGFCVGLEPKVAFNSFGGGGKVTYEEQLPIILPYPFNSHDEQWEKQIFFKLEQYRFEDEYRIQKIYFTPPTKDDRRITLPREAFSQIILGAEISEPNKKTIIELAQKELPHINIFQAELTKEKGIVLQKI